MVDGDVMVGKVADYAGKAWKGRIGLARRVHYIEEYSGDAKAPNWATSACGKWAGTVVLVPIIADVTCHGCKALERPWQVPATQVHPPGG
jgi:hypothetical protein